MPGTDGGSVEVRADAFLGPAVRDEVHLESRWLEIIGYFVSVLGYSSVEWPLLSGYKCSSVGVFCQDAFRFSEGVAPLVAGVFRQSQLRFWKAA